MANLAPEIPNPGFSFDLHQRNQMLQKKGLALPNATKTGTTIAGFIYKDGVILGADTRATSGSIIAEKWSEKIHYVADYMYCCGAGTAADTAAVTDMVSSQIELHKLNTNRKVPVTAACTILKQFLFRYQGHISAALILGGVDNDGPHLYSIYPHGSVDTLQYATMGSGCLAAMSVLEAKWKPGLSEQEAKDLMYSAICGGIFYDSASGNWADLCIIRSNFTVDYLRPYQKPNVKGQKAGSYVFKKGTTGVLKTRIIPIVVEESNERRIEQEAMDTSA